MSIEIAKIEGLEYQSIKYTYLKGWIGKQIYDGMFSTLYEQYLSCTTMENSIASFRRGKFSIETEERLGQSFWGHPRKYQRSSRDDFLMQISEELTTAHFTSVHVDFDDFHKMDPQMSEDWREASRVEASNFSGLRLKKMQTPYAMLLLWMKLR